jgi:oxepin-CoA hydrolase/3-oxo-5,6-dehydrosuberyl-CoA semialdehyde dehydrogenase
MSFHVRFTCKERISQDKKEPTDIARGIVKWLVEMIDDDNDELIGIATILTMVKKIEQ